MNSWVYLFSKFTSEALVFELLVIFSLMASYAAFWVLKKRRLGATQEFVPAGVFKHYLNELISEAHFLRNQLFGILGDMGVPTAGPAMVANVDQLAAKIAAGPAMGPATSKGLDEIQAKLNAQILAYQTLETEKKKIEGQLATAKAAGTATVSASQGGDTKVLQDKVTELEGKLAEYAIIEDDLAQLKRLQQENEQLRNAMAGKGVAPTTTISAAAAATSATAAAPIATPTDAPGFENIVDQVEASIAPEVAPVAAAPVEMNKTDSVAAIMTDTVATETATPEPAPAPAEVAAAPSPAPAPEGASDQDLLSEFEKMLNG